MKWPHLFRRGRAASPIPPSEEYPTVETQTAPRPIDTLPWNDRDFAHPLCLYAGADFLVVPVSAWQLGLALAGAYGWRPAGTLYTPPDSRRTPPVRAPYLPAGGQIVEGGDARAIAQALRRGLEAFSTSADPHGPTWTSPMLPATRIGARPEPMVPANPFNPPGSAVAPVKELRQRVMDAGGASCPDGLAMLADFLARGVEVRLGSPPSHWLAPDADVVTVRVLAPTRGDAVTIYGLPYGPGAEVRVEREAGERLAREGVVELLEGAAPRPAAVRDAGMPAYDEATLDRIRARALAGHAGRR